ncbi:excisionase [Cronobacter sakazakii]|uniref:excisionase n=1 Tax=Cronobacter sakazakii TaxID=28141 RepID=UPI000CFC3941|nr:excisionase [Cronobacter sakazakii]KAB0807505.1 excisionase [Cronobacter sakazakii]MCU7759148.1 excisionase [Cronobacter sakazakii]MDI7262899.1 excisionase [Cronobacter sakazakii]MDI7280082.1 excisionase [Cronobacter sakazakii]MDI7285901.1 excisionase [Cronobacter sakazakii]
MLQMMTLEEWAAQKYRSNPPSLNTLRRYAKQSMFTPPARKEGRYWRVREDAEITGNITHPLIKSSDSSLLQRILKDGSQTT